MHDQHYPFQLPPLPYDYGALEPYIDTETLRYHHDKHFKKYVDDLNKTLKPYESLHRLTLEEILCQPKHAHEHEHPLGEDWQVVLDNAGGAYNHDIYFKGLAPPESQPRLPCDQLLAMIDSQYGSFEDFKKAFTALGMCVFGSGWACLALGRDGRAHAVRLANQDTVVPEGMTPLLLFDVWEHAYYLKHKNKRDDYLTALWHVARYPELKVI